MNQATEEAPRDTIEAVVLTAAEELSPEEIPVLLGCLEPLIEMAQEGELAYIDPRDLGGGFDSTDPLFATLIPAVVFLFKSLGRGLNSKAISLQLGLEIERVTKLMNSENGYRQREAIKDTVLRAWETVHLQETDSSES